MKRNRESGQAAVESAITLPMTVFLVLGTLQLFMMLQGRIMAEHAVFKAVRTGSVQFADCRAMTHAAVAALLPSFTTYLGGGTPGGSPGEKLAAAFRARTQGKPNDNAYNGDAANPERSGIFDGVHDGAIVWLYRESPRMGDVSAASEDDFDDPDTNGNTGEVGYRLEVRLVYWFPLRIPFANYTMATMFRAYFGITDYATFIDPTMPVKKNAGWTAADGGGASLGPLTGEFVRRYDLKQYVFPITASYGMRMMSPPRRTVNGRPNYVTQNCPGAL